MPNKAGKNQFDLKSLLRSSDMQFSFMIIFVILIMIIPFPPMILDFLLTMSIAIGFLLLLISIYVKEPLEFSTFPTLLLVTTLFRLSLNVATTRSILLDGASSEVSQVVKAFGDIVVGGNYFVGFVIFVILVVINFIVITKGAGRVAEVSARFTLDAMPGKQMSIDADLNAGVIDRDEAKRRRVKIEREADFFGSMDGASKFVRGDAIAGIIITAVNIIFGLILGVVQYNMEFAQAAKVFTLLTVGDGLVSQIPALVISVAAGIVVTRANSGNGLSEDLSGQMFFHPKAFYICSALMLPIAVIPGFPKIPFILLSLLCFFLGKFASGFVEKKEDEKNTKAEQVEVEAAGKNDSIEALLHLDILALEVGVGLIPLVDTSQDGEVLERIVSTRKQFAQDMGIVVPMVMVRDNIQLKPGEYQLLLKGNPIASGNLMVDYMMAMAPEDILDPIDGIRTKEPAYGLDAIWVKPSQRDEATFRGYTVVNNATVIVTHLTKVVKENAYQLIGRQETQKLVESLREEYPKVVEEVIASDRLTLGDVVKVLQNLLAEDVSVRDLLTIFETLADHCKHLKNTDALTRHVRIALGRGIVRQYLSHENKLISTSLDRGVEDLLISRLHSNEDGSTSLRLEPELANPLLRNLAEVLKRFETKGTVPILICGSLLRWDLKKMVTRFIPGLVVLSFDEVPSDIPTDNIGTVTL